MLNFRQIVYLYVILRRWMRRRNSRSCYMKGVNVLNVNQRFEIFWRNYESENEDDLRQFCRFSRSQFDALHSLISDDLKRQSTHRHPLNSKERLAIFLRYFAQGLSHRAVAQEFLVGNQTVSEIITTICNTVPKKLSRIYMPRPNRNLWEKNVEEFEALGFPHVLGCLDGKHFECNQPPGTGSRYFNYKGYFSVVMLAVADAKCRFVMADIGAAGRQSDSGLYATSKMKTFVDSREAEIPCPQAIGEIRDVPFVFLGDGGFKLSENIMTPFTQRSTTLAQRRRYNSRLSRVRRTVECAFGTLVRRFRRLHYPLEYEPKRCAKLIHVGILLHNFLIDHGSSINTTDTSIPTAPTISRAHRGALPCLPSLYREKFVAIFTADE